MLALHARHYFLCKLLTESSRTSSKHNLPFVNLWPLLEVLEPQPVFLDIGLSLIIEN